jgi:hypothetical protein
MKDLKTTKGEWWPCCKDTRPHFIFVGEEDKVVCAMSSNEKDSDNYEPLMAEVSMVERIANAALIADAGNTAQLCGLLPSELLKQRDELLEAAKGIAELLPLTPTQEEWTNACVKLESVITKIEEK